MMGIAGVVIGGILIGIVITVATIMAKKEGEREIRSPTITSALIIIIAISLSVVGGFFMFFNENDTGIPNDKLPPENTPMMIKTVDWENQENLVYLTLVSYNDVNGTRKLYRISRLYRISWDDCNTSINLSPEME